MKQVRWGIIGTGDIANRFAEACKNTENAQLAAVCSRSAEKAEAFADKHGIPVRFGSYEAMAQSDVIDAAYIATPHSLHCPNGILFMQNGKAVLSEKPITCSSEELERMIACAKENDVFLMEGMWARAVPGIVKIKEILDSGALGKVRGMEGCFSYDMRDEPEHHAFKLEYGGGSMLDVGCYAMHFASWFAPAPVAEIQTVGDVSEANGTDDTCHVLLRYEDNSIAHMVSGMTLNRPSDGAIFCDDGRIALNRFYATQDFVVYQEGEEPQEYHVPYKGNGFEHEIEEANNCILAGKKESDLIPHAQSLEIMRQMDTVREKLGIVYPPQK